MFEDLAPGWHARADQLLETAIDSTLDMAAAVDGLDETEAVAMLTYSIIDLGISRHVLAQAVAGLAVRMRRTNSREPFPTLE